MEQNILVKARYTSPSSLCLLHYNEPTLEPFRSFQKHPQILLKYLSQKLLQSPRYERIIFVGVDSLPCRIYQDNATQKFGINIERGKILEINLYTENIIKDLKETKDTNLAKVPFPIRLARYILNQLPGYKLHDSPSDNEHNSSHIHGNLDQNGHNEIAPSVGLIFDSMSALFPVFDFFYPDVKLFISTLTHEGSKLFSNHSVSPILSVLDDNAFYVGDNAHKGYQSNLNTSSYDETISTTNMQRWLALIDLARINIEISPCAVSDNCLNHGTLKMFRKMIQISK